MGPNWSLWVQIPPNEFHFTYNGLNEPKHFLIESWGWPYAIFDIFLYYKHGRFFTQSFSKKGLNQKGFIFIKVNIQCPLPHTIRI